jgi:hypothetical protein
MNESNRFGYPKAVTTLILNIDKQQIPKESFGRIRGWRRIAYHF